MFEHQQTLAARGQSVAVEQPLQARSVQREGPPLTVSSFTRFSALSFFRWECTDCPA